MIFNKNTLRLVLTIFGVVGVPLTSWISVKCSEKAKDETTTKGKVKRYIPAIISGAATTASIIGSHRVSSKEIAALTATASFAVANRDKLEEAVKPYISKEEVAKLKEASVEETNKIHKSQTIEWTGRGKIKVLEGFSGRLFYSSLEAVKLAEEKLCKALNNGIYISLNDFYSYLGIQQTDFGRDYGWAPVDEWYARWFEDNPIGFDNTFVEDEDGSPMIVISMEALPMGYYWEV